MSGVSYKTRKPFKKVKWYRKKYTVKVSPYQVAMKALKGVKYLKGLVNSERHVTDISAAYSGTITTSTTNQTMSLIRVAIGDTNSTRTGNSILCKTVQIKGFLDWDAASLTDRVRMILVQDKQQISDTIPNWSDFYTGDINSFPANFSHQRFKVLGSYTFNQTDDNRNAQVPVNIFLRYQTHVKYNGSLETDIAKNGLYLIMISNKAAGSQPPSFSCNTRITFYDN